MMIRTLETLIYDCPNSTSNGPPKRTPIKKRFQQWGSVSREALGGGGQDPLHFQWLRPWNVVPREALKAHATVQN